MMTNVLTLVCMAALYLIYLYWVSREIAAQTQKVLHHLAATDAKLEKLLSVLATSEAQAVDVLDALTDNTTN